MAVKIPTYEDRLVPQGAGPSPVFRPAEMSDAIGRGMQNLGNQAMDLAAVNMHLEQKRETEKAINNMGPDLANASVEWPNRVTELSKKAVNGGMVPQEDGSFKPLTQQLKEEWATYRQGFLDKIPNEKVRNYASSQLDSTWANTYRHSLNSEATMVVNNKLDKIGETVKTYTAGAALDLDAAATNLKSAKELVANSGLDEHTRNQTALAAQKSIVEAAVTGAMKRDPSLTRAALLERFGVTEGQLSTVNGPAKPNPNLTPAASDSIAASAGRLGVSAQDLQAIIGYETGGTFDPSKRGGKNNKHIGLIQFGEAEQKAFGANQQQTFAEQMVAVEKYLKARGVQPGDDLKTIYKIVNGGNRNVSETASDGNGTIAEHVDRIRKDYGGGGAAGASASGPKVKVPENLSMMVAMLDTGRAPEFITAAQSEMTRMQTTYRSQIGTTENDHVSMAMNGNLPQKPLTEAEYTDYKAYGPVEGAQRYANYQAIMAMGSDMNAMKLQTPEQIQAMVSKYQPDPSKPGYDLANKRYAMVQEAANRVSTARNTDPIQYAIDTKAAPVTTINFNDQEKAMAELKNRVGVAATMAGTFKTPYALLTKEEAGKMAAGLNVMNDVEKKNFFGAIAKAIPNQDALEAIMQQIAPDSPVSAVIGKLATMDAPNVVAKGAWYRNERAYNPQVVASMIARGETLINPGKTAKGEDGKPKINLLPKEQDFDRQFYNEIGDTFPGQQRNGYNVAMQSVKAYYAAASEQASDYSGEIKSDRLHTAIEAVTGGATTINGTKVRRPWGMMEDTFVNQAKSAFDAKMVEIGRKGMEANFFRFGLENFGSGYRVREGTGYMRDNEGKMIVLDVTGQMAPPARPPVDPTQPVGVKAKPFTQTPNTK